MDRGKTIMFFDNSNVFQGCKNSGWRPDIRKLHDRLSKDGSIWQTFFFAATNDPPRYQQTNFYNFLKKELRFETVIFELGKKTVHCKHCGHTHVAYTEKGVDVALATKMLTLASRDAFDTAILVSGDKDYLETIETMKGMGKRVEIVSWRNSLSNAIERESSSKPFIFDDYRAEIEFDQTTPEEPEELLEEPK